MAYSCEDQQGAVEAGLVAVWEDASSPDQRLCTETWTVSQGDVLLARQSMTGVLGGWNGGARGGGVLERYEQTGIVHDIF